MKTAYVTGATGCVGRNLVDELVGNNWEVTALHRPSSDLSRLAGVRIETREVDLHSLESVRRAVGKADAVFHVAGSTSHWAPEQAEQWKDNVLATRNLAQVSLEKGIRRFLFTSTWATGPYQLTDERSAQEIDIPYIRTKRLAELEVFKAAEKGLDVIVLQPIIVVGAYDYNSYSQIFCRLHARDPRARGAFPGRIQFCHARDVARAHRIAFERGRSCERYVLGGPHLTWLEAFQAMARAVGAPPPAFAYPTWVLLAMSYLSAAVAAVTRKKPDLTPFLVRLVKESPPVPYIDTERARVDLGYESRSLEEMVNDCRDWMVRERMLG